MGKVERCGYLIPDGPNWRDQRPCPRKGEHMVEVCGWRTGPLCEEHAAEFTRDMKRASAERVKHLQQTPA